MVDLLVLDRLHLHLVLPCSLYSHLNNSYVRVGQNITPGTIVGGMGNTGSTYSLHGGTGSHLDYRIKDLYGKYVNPSQYLAKYKS